MPDRDLDRAAVDALDWLIGLEDRLAQREQPGGGMWRPMGVTLGVAELLYAATEFAAAESLSDALRHVYGITRPVLPLYAGAPLPEEGGDVG